MTSMTYQNDMCFLTSPSSNSTTSRKENHDTSSNTTTTLNLVSHFQDYLVNGTYTDISVSIVQANVKYTLRCHQAVLASASAFLSQLLQEHAKEGYETALVLTDMCHDELEQLISFLYTGLVTFNNRMASQKFQNLLHHLRIDLPSTSKNFVEEEENEWLGSQNHYGVVKESTILTSKVGFIFIDFISLDFSLHYLT